MTATVPSSSPSSAKNAKDASSSSSYDVVRVDLENGRDYPIYIGSNFDDGMASSLLRKHVHGRRILLVTNDNIAPMYLEKYERLLASSSSEEEEDDARETVVDTLILPDGEEYKSLEILNTILDRALELGLDRKSTFVALGGGVIGDMVGFASAIYQRGVDFIQVRALLLPASRAFLSSPFLLPRSGTVG
jgi:3-dehydroquinate synthase